MKKRQFFVFVLVTSLALILTWAVAAQGPASVQYSPSAQTTGNPPTLNLNLGEGDSLTLDPAKAADAASTNVIEQLFIGLVDLDDETAEVRPELATSWTTSPDGAVYTFTLRSDVTWSDGRPVTAGDARYGILRSLDPETESNYAYVLAWVIENGADYNDGTITDPNLVGVTAVNTTTLRITLEEPGVHVLSILSMWMARPMPQWAIEAHGVPTWTEPANIVTNGPYQLTEWVHGDHILLDKDPTYHDAANVQIEQVRMWMTDDALALAMYRAGDLDTTQVPFSEVEDDPVLSQELRIVPRGCTYYYGFNTSKPPVDNVHMRRALSHAINRWGVVNDVVKAGQQPAQWFCPPGMVGCPTMDSHPNAGIQTNLSAAQTELQAYMAEMGYSSVEEIPEITLMHNTSEGHRLIAEYIGQNWMDNLGVTVTISHTDYVDYLNLVNTDAPQVWRMGWCLDYPDANNWGRQNFAIGGYRENATQWHNQEFTDLCEDAALETDPATRRDMYAEAETILCYEEAAIAPIYWYTQVGLTKPYLHRTYPVRGFDIATWRFTQVSDVIGPGGGGLTSYDGETTVQFPSGAVTGTVVVTHTPASGNPPGGNLNSIGNAFDLTAVYSGTDPGTAGLPAQIVPGYTYTVTAQYSDTQLGPTMEDTLGLYWWNAGASEWSQQGITSSVNVTDNMVTAQVDHFSLFDVLGETLRVYLPLVLRNS
jgi:oligopeptide transport system substrate-binding protein